MNLKFLITFLFAILLTSITLAFGSKIRHPKSKAKQYELEKINLHSLNEKFIISNDDQFNHKDSSRNDQQIADDKMTMHNLSEKIMSKAQIICDLQCSNTETFINNFSAFLGSLFDDVEALYEKKMKENHKQPKELAEDGKNKNEEKEGRVGFDQSKN